MSLIEVVEKISSSMVGILFEGLPVLSRYGLLTGQMGLPSI
jgi:hypothetical protein